MSEKNNIFENDLLMRAILESGQEEVPGRVWDAVSERLDKAEASKVRKPVTLWFGRAAMAVAAAAAVVAAVILFNRDQEQLQMVPRAVQGDMIAVVEPEVAEDTESVVSQTSGADLFAYVPAAETKKTDYIEQLVSAEESAAEAAGNEERTAAADPEGGQISEETAQNQVITTDSSADVIADKNVDATPKANDAEAWQSFDEWEDETPVRKVKTSITVSGLTGSAQQQNNTGGGGILKAPSLVLTPTQTGIKEKENQTKYGIPVSVGAGVRFEFTPRWSLGVGLNYTHLTRTLQGTYTHVNEAGSIDNLVTSEIRNSQHYIGLPVNAFFNIINNDHISFYTYAGGTVEKCLSDRYHVMANHVIHKEKADGVQMSAAIGLGAEFGLTQHLGLYIDPSLRYYFDCDQPKSIRTAQPLMFSVEAGLRFRL